MSSYYREQGYGNRNRFLRHIKFVWLLLVVGLLAVIGFFAYDAFMQSRQSDQPSVESKTETSLITTDSQLITTPYFQFQAAKKWRAIANETRSNHFVYRYYNGPLVEQEFVVDINSTTQEAVVNTLVTRAQPVTVTAAGRLVLSGAISPHCKDVIKPATTAEPLVASYKNAKFGCSPRASNYFAVASLVGGSESMQLPRPDGTKAVYNIRYKNITAQPDAGDFDNILQTFETR